MTCKEAAKKLEEYGDLPFCRFEEDRMGRTYPCAVNFTLSYCEVKENGIYVKKEFVIVKDY